ncbi:MAG: elongation factor P [Planctomycetota bacterium]|nr:MAG: elongation factor P [Planctomycetota bacterium]
MPIKATEIRKGQILLIEGGLWLVTDFEHIAPGNWRAINQVKCKNLTTGSTKQMRLGSSEVVELAYLEKRPCTYLYKEGDHFVFMDSQNYEQHHLGADVVGESMQYVRDNQEVLVTFHDGRPISVDLPSAVVLQVKEAEIGVKGDSVTNSTKGAVLETGLAVRVPMHINAGDYVKISTENGEFLGRTKGEDRS